MRADGGSNRMMERQVMLLPLPLSPTRPSTSPSATESETPSTAFTTPSARRNTVRRFSIRRSSGGTSAHQTGQTIAEHTEADPNARDRQAGEHRQPPSGHEELARLRHHRPPFRIRRLHPESQEPERGP